MSEALKDIENLLKKIQVKVTHSKELTKLTGENFNIFSILKLESNENKTHSRFIGELMNPKGSHDMGSIFLSKFLGILGICENDFDIDSAYVIVEKPIGSRDDVGKFGGRIDVAISDKNGKNIFIENKIFAGDQIAQIERYCNYHTNKSKVYYLTLFGKDPVKKSKGKLQSGIDFYCISYKETITGWLELCIKEATDHPILRETIKQYIILIKKLTGQLINDSMSKDVEALILADLESASVVYNNFVSAKNIILDKIRDGLLDSLRNELKDYLVEKVDVVGARNSKIWFYHKEVDKKLGIHFGIEPFSGIGNRRNELFIGIIDVKNINAKTFNNDISKLESIGWWRGVYTFDKFKGFNIEFANVVFLQYLRDNPEDLEELIIQIKDRAVGYIKNMEEVYLKICKVASNSIEP